MGQFLDDLKIFIFHPKTRIREIDYFPQEEELDMSNISIMDIMRLAQKHGVSDHLLKRSLMHSEKE